MKLVRPSYPLGDRLQKLRPRDRFGARVALDGFAHLGDLLTEGLKTLRDLSDAGIAVLVDEVTAAGQAEGEQESHELLHVGSSAREDRSTRPSLSLRIPPEVDSVWQTGARQLP